jgi:hypothetical protein
VWACACMDVWIRVHLYFFFLYIVPSLFLFLRAVFHLNYLFWIFFFFQSHFWTANIFSFLLKKTSKKQFEGFLLSRIVEVVGLLRQSLSNCHFVIGWKSSSYRRGKNRSLKNIISFRFRFGLFLASLASFPPLVLLLTLPPVPHTVNTTKENTRVHLVRSLSLVVVCVLCVRMI